MTIGGNILTAISMNAVKLIILKRNLEKAYAAKVEIAIIIAVDVKVIIKLFCSA
jgi:hypothetical protein